MTSNPTVAPSGFSLAPSLGTPSVNGTSNITAAPAGYGLAAALGAPTIAKFSNATPRRFSTTLRFYHRSITLR